MQARAAFGGQDISNTLVAVFAAIFVFGLGAAAGFVANDISGSTASHVSAAQGQRSATFGNPARRTGYQVLAGKPTPKAPKQTGFTYPAAKTRIGAHV